VLGVLHLDEGLVFCAARDFEIDGPAAVIGFGTYVGWSSIPDEAVEDVEVFLTFDGSATIVEQTMAALVLNVVLEVREPGVRFLVGASRDAIKVRAGGELL